MDRSNHGGLRSLAATAVQAGGGEDTTEDGSSGAGEATRLPRASAFRCFRRQSLLLASRVGVVGRRPACCRRGEAPSPGRFPRCRRPCPTRSGPREPNSARNSSNAATNAAASGMDRNRCVEPDDAVVERSARPPASRWLSRLNDQIATDGAAESTSPRPVSSGPTSCGIVEHAFAHAAEHGEGEASIDRSPRCGVRTGRRTWE